MAYNLVIAYDLPPPGQNYEAVRNRIKQLGDWYHLQYSVFYVHSRFTPQQAHDHIRAVMDVNDKLAVFAARCGTVSPITQADFNAINVFWLKAA